MQTNELTTISVLRLFETSKDERGEFVHQLIEKLDNGEADPLETHLQVKCMEDVVKQVTSNEKYKEFILEAAKKEGKSFMHHNAKFEIKEVGTKYDFESCNDQEYNELTKEFDDLKEKIKQRETFLKTIAPKGMDIITGEGEVITIYPPVKTSTTSVAVTLK